MVADNYFLIFADCESSLRTVVKLIRTCQPLPIEFPHVQEADTNRSIRATFQGSSFVNPK